jgi:hypothetical protein
MKNRRLLTMLGFVGVVIGVIVGRPLINSLLRPATPPQATSPSNVPPSKVAPSPQQLAEPHLDSAKSKTEKVIEGRLVPVRTFFDDSKKNTRQFAEVALGWGSKWRLIADHVPFTKGGRHETYIRGQFEQTVFSAQQLEDIVSSAVSEYLSEIRSIENQMLVSLRADVAGFPDAYPIAQLDETQLRAKFDEAIKNAIAATGSQVQADIGTQLVSIIGGEVLTQVAVRLGISAGILGTGAASGWATLGIGVVVGIIVDQIVSWVWDWWTDPTGNLATNLDAKLDEMRTLICDGDTKVEGLRQRFQSLAAERAKIRETAILDLLSSNQGSK